MRRLALSFLAVVTMVGCTSREETSALANPAPVAHERAIDDGVSAAEIASTYTQFTRMTDEPVAVNPDLSMLCISPSPEMVAAARKKSGPHTLAFVTIYMNQIAAGAFEAKVGEFPVGSAIVKEKSGMSDPRAPGPDRRPKRHDGVGGMIKRAPGYDPGHGDWEYFYFDDPAKIETGRIASCAQCHAGAAKTDHVYGGWHNRDTSGWGDL